METLHAELLPDWLVIGTRPPDERAVGELEASFQKVRAAARDTELLAVLEDLNRLIAGADPSGAAPEVATLQDAYNARLAALGEPYFVRWRVFRREGRGFVFGGFYRLLDEPAVRVGDKALQALILSRVDHTNLWEAFLGAARGDGDHAFIITDRIADFAVDTVWPLLGGEDHAARDPIARAFAAPVRAELKRALGERTFTTLQRAAQSRQAILTHIKAIRGRVTCGSQFRIVDPPFNGYTPRTLDRLDQYAERDRHRPCPSVRRDEAEALRTASLALQRTEVRGALETLVAWLTRAITVHEVRHHADHLLHDEEDGGPPCPGCPEGAPGAVRAELSAYTASFAWSETPATALFQACHGADTPGHRQGLVIFLGRLGSLCDAPPPKDLAQRARAIERELFSRDEPVVLDKEFVKRVAIRSWDRL